VPAWCRSVRACSTCWWRLVGAYGVRLADEGVEAVDEFAVAFGFAGPASGAEAASAGHARFDGGCFPPVSVADVDQGQRRAS
jgi:hypothetical protein